MLLLSLVGYGTHASAQEVTPTLAPLQEAASASNVAGPVSSEAPVTITLHDAIARARQYYAAYRAAETTASLAKESQLQVRASLLPTVSYTQQYLGTQGNGRVPTGRFVTNDGVHVYRAWAVLHQDVPAGFFTLAPYRRAEAVAAQARAQAEIARRGLTVTVTTNYYGFVVAQRKYAAAQQSLEQARRFLKTTSELERGGQVARADVLKARLQFDQQQLAFQEAQLGMENAHLALAVLLSPSLDENFITVDDIDDSLVLPPFVDLEALAGRENEYVRSAVEALKQAKVDVSTARAGFLPTFTLDADYGIEANAFALHSTIAADPQKGVLPNLGYFVTAVMNIPVWNWGATGSRLHQAKFTELQAQVELSQAQREALSNLHAYYNEARVARSEIDTLREDVGLASEALRLATLRYKAGEAIQLEVLDAQNALVAARNAHDSGQARYRVAVATLQTLTGEF